MKLALFALFSLTTSSAVADVLTLLPSSQLYTLTGLGGNVAQVTFGSCAYDGTNTVCTLSGNYTGLGGGAYRFQLTYPGDGPSPLQAVFPPGSDLYSYNLTSQGTLTDTIMPNSGGTFSFQLLSFFIYYDSTATCTGTPTCGTGSVAAVKGATITGRQSGQFDPTPVIKSVITASGYGGASAIAPGTWVEIYGTNLGTAAKLQWGGADFNGSQAPTALGGTTVKVGGQAAFVEYVNPDQVNVQIPSTVSTGQQPVILTTAGGSSIAASVTVNSVQPGLLAPAVLKVNGVPYAEALFPDGSTYVLPPVAGVPTRRAKPGDTIMLYGVGFGPVSPNINAGSIVGQSNLLSGFQATIGGKAATVPFAGLVAGFVGLYQFNVVIPSVPASDSTTLTFSINGNAGTQTLYLPISN